MTIGAHQVYIIRVRIHVKHTREIALVDRVKTVTVNNGIGRYYADRVTNYHPTAYIHGFSALVI